MQQEPREEKQGSWIGWLLMAACCVPMVIIIVLVAMGYWTSP
jgi:hypothetical protein